MELEDIWREARARIDEFWVGGARRSVVWNPQPKAAKDISKGTSWESRLGERVRLIGTAQNAKLGAVVAVEGRPVYLSGKDGWEPGLPGRKVRVEGILRTFDLPPAGQEDGAWSAGVGGPGKAYRLEDARWQAAD